MEPWIIHPFLVCWLSAQYNLFSLLEFLKESCEREFALLAEILAQLVPSLSPKTTVVLHSHLEK
jgi:hypothetical protein